VTGPRVALGAPASVLPAARPALTAARRRGRGHLAMSLRPAISRDSSSAASTASDQRRQIGIGGDRAPLVAGVQTPPSTSPRRLAFLALALLDGRVRLLLLADRHAGSWARW
jgi:hypothetical protein